MNAKLLRTISISGFMDTRRKKTRVQCCIIISDVIEFSQFCIIISIDTRSSHWSVRNTFPFEQLLDEGFLVTTVDTLIQSIAWHQHKWKPI